MQPIADTADLDNGPRAKQLGTERMCVVSRTVRPIDELIRFVVAPTGEAIPDLKRKLPGRGLWVSANHKAVAEAVRRNLFSKGFKKPVKASPTLAQDTDAMMVRGVIDALAITAKAGQLVSGYTKVQDALRQRAAHGLIHASDGAPDGIRKLGAVARSTAAMTREMSREAQALRNAPEHDITDESDDDIDDIDDDFDDDDMLDDEAEVFTPRIEHNLPVVTVLTSDELDLALGRSNVIHAALLAGAASKTFLSRSQTLVRYRMADDSKADVGGKANDKAKDKAKELMTATLETKTPETEPHAAQPATTEQSGPQAVPDVGSVD